MQGDPWNDGGTKDFKFSVKGEGEQFTEVVSKQNFKAQPKALKSSPGCL